MRTFLFHLRNTVRHALNLRMIIIFCIIIVSDGVVLNDPESPQSLTLEYSALLESPILQTVQNHSDHRSYIYTEVRLPDDDPLALSLEYLGRRRDIENFRKVSEHFERIYQRFKRGQSRKFNEFKLIFQDSRDSQCTAYQSMDDLLECIPSMPDTYVDVLDDRNIDRLLRTHYVSNHEIYRGLTSRVNQPFLSLFLWNDEHYHEAMLLICVFGKDDLVKVIRIKCLVASEGIFRYRLGRCELSHPQRFDMFNLKQILNSKVLRNDEGNWCLRQRTSVDKLCKILITERARIIISALCLFSGMFWLLVVESMITIER